MTRGFLGNINKTKYNGAAFRWTGVVCATERDGGEGGKRKKMKKRDGKRGTASDRVGERERERWERKRDRERESE